MIFATEPKHENTIHVSLRLVARVDLFMEMLSGSTTKFFVFLSYHKVRK